MVCLTNGLQVPDYEEEVKWRRIRYNTEKETNG